MAALLYLGAGIGIGIMSLFNKKDREKAESLTKAELPYIVGMIVLDILCTDFSDAWNQLWFLCQCLASREF